MTRLQCKAARAMLDWSQLDLACATFVGEATIKRFETGKPITDANLATLRRAFEEKGIEFLADNGVQLKS